MPDQDFNIRVVTTADLTGVKQVGENLDAIARRQAEAEAKWLRSPLNPKNQTGGGIVGLGGGPPTPPGGGGGGGAAGFGASAAGIGTITYLITGAIKRWQEFNDEMDKQAESMMKATERSRELGLAVADMMDAMKSEERIDTEPLQVSFDRLKQKVTELKTEIHLAFEAGRYEDVKKYAAALGVVESQLNRVTSAIQRQGEEEERAAKKREQAAEKERKSQESFIGGAVQTSSAQVQRALQQEEAARRAAAAGDQRSAAQFQKSSEAFQRGFTPAQSDEFTQLKTAIEKQGVTLEMILQQFR